MAARPDPADADAATCAQLLSLAVHELRTPLSVVAGYVRMLRQDASTPRSEREAKMLRDTESVCERMAALLSEMSELSKLDAGAALMKDEAFDLFAVVHEVSGTVQEAADRGVRLQAHGPATGGTLRGDRGRIAGALTALLRSVLREQMTACTVLADCYLDASTSSAVIVIAEESLAATATSAPPVTFDEKRGGLGLLLPIAKRIVEHHGGRLWTTGPRGATIVSFPTA